MKVFSTPSFSNTCLGTVTSGNVAGNGSLAISGATIPVSPGSCVISVQVTSTVVAASPGMTNTTSTVTSTNANASITASANLIVNPAPLSALTIAKSFSPSTIGSGDITTMSFNIGSTNTGSVSNANFTDTLTNMTVASATIGGCGGAVTNSPALVVGATALNLTVPTVFPGGCIVTIQVTSSVVGTNPNSVSGVTTTSGTPAGTGFGPVNLTVVNKPTIAKAFSPATISSGGTSALTFTLGNSNASALTNATFTDTLTSMSIASTGITGTCVGVTNTPALTVGATALNLSVPSLPAGGCTVTVQVTSSTGGALPNTSSGVTTTQSPTVGVASNTANLTVTTPLAVTKSFAVPSIASGGKTQLTISLSNPGGSAITLSSAFSDTLPTTPGNMVVATPNNLAGTCTGVTATAGAGSISVASGTSIPAGGCTIIVDVTATTLGSYTNTIAVGAYSTSAGSNTVAATANLSVVALPTITKSFAAPSITSGGTTLLTITIGNANASAITLSSALTDTLPTTPGNMVVATPNNLGGTCTGVTATAGSGTVTMASGTSIPSGGCTITLNVTATTTGSYTNTIPIGALATSTGSNATAATASLAVMAPPTVTKTFLTNPVAKDAASVLSIAITNPNNVAITGAAFTDNFPVVPDNKLVIFNPGNPGFTAASTTAGCLGTVTGANGAQVFSLSGGTIPANTTCTVTVNVKSASNTNPTYVNSTGPVTTTNAGTGTAASDSLNVVNGLTASKSFSPSTISTGGISQLTLTLATTAGGAGSTGAAITDTYPAGLVNASGTPLVSNSCAGTVTAAAGANSVSLAGGTIPPNASCTIVVNVTAAAAGSYVNTLPVGALVATSPAGSTSVADSATLTVLNPPTISKAFAVASIVGGGKTQLTLTLGNSNASAITLSSVLTDTLPVSPGAMVIATPNNLGGTCSGVTAVAGSGTITVASGTSIPPGGCTVTVDITASTLGTYTNTIPAGGLATSAGSNAAATNASLIVPALPTISKSFAPSAIAPGGASTMTFTFGNINAGPLTNANLTDTLGNMSISATGIGGTCVGVTSSPALAVGATGLNLTIPSLPSGGCTVTLQITSSTLGTWPNTTSGVTATETPVVGSVSNTANLQVTNLPPNYILGTVFEDVNYGGGAGRSLASSNGVGVAGARVELYNNLGSFVSFTTTAVDGSYAFTGLATANYTVRVPNFRVASTRPGACAAGTCIPVQTFRTDATSGTAVAVTDRVGGQTPSKLDAGDGSTSLASLTTATTVPQSSTTVAVSATGTTGVDFGYNYDTIVNKNLTGQGSLQQFIINSNALGGEASLAQAGFRLNNGISQSLPAGKETSIFMAANGVAHPGLVATFASQVTSNRLLINYTSGGPGIITGADTIIDGTTQTYNVGDTLAGVTGAGGSVGIDGLSLGSVQLPEVEILGNSAQSFGIQFNGASNSVLRGTAIWKFGNTATSGNVVVNSTSGVLIEQNLIGSAASGFSDPGAARTAGNCVYATGGSSALTIIHNLIGYCTLSNVAINGATATLSNNEIRGSATADGIQVAGVSNLSVAGNLISANGGAGVQLIGGVTNLQNNSVTNNASAGIGINGASSGNTIYRNIVTGTTAGPGIYIANAGSANNRISQNSTSLNNTLGIDLGTAGVSGNDGSTGGANDGMDYPIFTLGTLAADGTTLHIKGYVGSAAGQTSFANATIELFKANNDANQNGEVIAGDGKSLAHGEGQTYLGTITADASGNFDVTLTVAGMAIGQPLTATASRCASNPCAGSTAAGNTSEYSANFALTPIGINVSGTVYNNANHNGSKDPSETGTGLTLYAKLIQGGVVVQVVPVDTSVGIATSGTYTFTAVTIGSYSIIIDNNNLVGDITPTLPAGWVGTEAPTQTLPLSVTQSNTPMPNQNFGLYNGSRLSGTVFKDTGVTGGIANDGLRNGSEAGIPGATLSATNAACPSSLCDTTTTDGNGNYTLYIPATVGGSLVAINEVNVSGYVSTGGNAGTTGGSYVRAGDATSFTNVVGSTYSGVNFADVPDNGFLTDGAQNGLPGNVLFYAHTFTAGSAGSVVFTTSNVSTPATPAWNYALYQDSNCNGVLDGSEGATVLATTAVTAGQTLCVIDKVFVPAGAPMGAKDVNTITATMTYSNASPALVKVYTHTDTTTVAAVGTSSLTLTKSVDKAFALPNEVITYVITYANRSGVAIANVTINDVVPAYTLYVGNSAGCPNLVVRTVCTVPIEPANNAAGSLQWKITGNLAAGASGTVQYQVRVEQ